MPGRVRFVLVRTRNSLNMGAAARALANFGFADLVAVEPYEPKWREASSAVYGAELLAKAPVLTLAEAVADRALVLGTGSNDSRRLRKPVVPLPALADYIKERTPGGIAVLFGSEKFGLRNEDLAVCHALVRIPTRPEAPSMNLGQSVAAVAYELARGEMRREVSEKAESGPTAAQLEALLDAAGAALDAAKVNRHMSAATRRAYLKRMLLGWRMTAGDASFLQGLLKRLA
ncbi:RNA methyltransferase [bacterium]|nr:MAG: RNA methyltransferase [bacterium]